MTEPTERIVRFGQEGNLVATLTVPAVPRLGAPALLLANAGVVHRIGPHRLNVKLARALAEDGILSIRMDLSGLGDSAPATVPPASGEQSTADLRAAMTYVQETLGISRFVMFGVCSGAKNAYWLAQVDERLVAMALFDGYVYPTFKTHVVRRLARLRTLGPLALLRKPLEWWRRARARAAAETLLDREGGTATGVPTREEFVAALDALAARDVAINLLYSGGMLERYNYDGQSRDTLRGATSAGRIRDRYLPEIDHTVTSLASQRLLIGVVRDWVRDVAGMPAGGAAA